MLRAGRVTLFAAGLVLAAGAAFAQTAVQATAPSAASATAKHEFDVASVRPSAPLDMAKLQAEMAQGKMPNFGMHIDGMRVEYNYLSLKDLIALAYKVRTAQVTGPDWMGTEHYDILAKMPDGSTRDDATMMLQALLLDRFKLVVHSDTQEHPVLALVVGKSGPKMKESPGDAPALDPDAVLKPGEMKMDTPDGPARMTINKNGQGATLNMGTKGVITYAMDPQSQMMHVTSSKATMAALADMMTQMMQVGGGLQVLDQTGLKGNYEVSLDFSMADMISAARAQGYGGQGATGPTTPGVAEASDPGGGGTSLAKSVESLGLKLESRKAPMEQIVVFSAEKTPTEN